MIKNTRSRRLSAGMSVLALVLGAGLGVAPQADASKAPAVPVVSNVAPASGSTAGGNRVTITGSRFVKVTSVQFGDAAATSVTVNSRTQLTAVAPKGVAGVVDVRVTGRLGTSVASSVDRYTYVSPGPTLTLLPITDATLVSAASCPAPGHCYATGFSGSPRYDGYTTPDKPVIEVLSGTTWTSVAVPYQGLGHGTAVACSGVGECAVLVTGNTDYSGGGAVTPYYLETLHDGTWTNLVLPASVSWSALSCPGAQQCVVAGSTPTPLGTAFLTVNGTATTLTQGPTVPSASGGDYVTIAGLTCVTVDWCATWGSHGGHAFAGALDHGVATTTDEPTPADAGAVAGSSLDTVLCPAISACTGYGNYTLADGSVHPMSLVLADNVVTATTVPVIPDPTPGVAALTGAIHATCTAVGHCVASGTTGDTGGAILTLQADGWHERAIAPATGDLRVDMDSVACTTGEHCYVSATRQARGSTGYPVRRAVEFLPDGSEVALPGLNDPNGNEASGATCAAGSNFCLQLGYAGDFFQGYSYQAYGVTITE